MRNTWIARGTQKPPFGSQINPEHPFAQGHLLSVLFDGGGDFRFVRHEAVGDLIFNHGDPGPMPGPSILVGSAPPRDSILNDPFDAVGASWTQSSEGLGLWLPSSFANVDLQDSSFIPTKNVTICVIERPVNDSFDGFFGMMLFAAGQGTAAKSCYAMVPATSDGTIYWRFGGTSAPNQLTLAGQTFPFTPQRWIFHAGDAGSAIWRNGVKIASQSTAISRTATTAAETLTINGLSSNSEGKSREYIHFHMVGVQWSDDLCRWWSAEPYEHLYSETSVRRFFLVAPQPLVDGLFIDGVAHDPLLETFSISKTINAIDTLYAEFESTDASPVRFALDLPVRYNENGAALFGGYVMGTKESRLGGEGEEATDNLVIEMDASDNNVLARRRYVTGERPEESLKDRAAWLFAYLAAPYYGVVFDTSMATGPTLPARSYVYVALQEALAEAVTLTAEAGASFFWRINASKLGGFYQAGTESAPFDLIDGDTRLLGDIEVDEQRTDTYANYVIVVVPPKAVADYTEAWTGDGVTDTFALVTVTTEAQTRGLVNNNGVDQTLCDSVLSPGTATWEFDGTVTPKTVTKISGPAPGNGDPITLVVFTGSLTLTGKLDGQGSPADPALRWEYREEAPDLTTHAEVDARVDALLVEKMAGQRTITWKTFETGLEPGQVHHVTSAKRNLNGDFLIIAVTIRYFEGRAPVGAGDALVREVTAVGGTVAKGSWEEVLKQWSGVAA